MTIRYRLDAEDVLRFIEGLAPAVDRAMEQAMERQVGPTFARAANLVTRSEEAFASGNYYRRFRHEAYAPSPATAGRALVNDAPYAHYVEFGREPGRMPPRYAILRWMHLRGIPETALFPIRRAIAERGTVKRKGYKGFEIFRQVGEMTEAQVIGILDDAFVRAFTSV